MVKQRFRVIAVHPDFKLGEVFGVGAHMLQRHLMRAERALHWLTIDLLWPSPAFGRAQHDGRPARLPRDALHARLSLNGANLRIAGIQRRGKLLMQPQRVVPLKEIDLIAVPF